MNLAELKLLDLRAASTKGKTAPTRTSVPTDVVGYSERSSLTDRQILDTARQACIDKTLSKGPRSSPSLVQETPFIEKDVTLNGLSRPLLGHERCWFVFSKVHDALLERGEEIDVAITLE
ncbi:hypothetical protein LTS07_000701 [Exophiala sideris]|uniref:Uncharacterized protein n=1 Tax=Exophiala sideris TaxID=1016849 RepID=A0ABR0JSF3_9EURO|nr:hypothetical protein LTS07_000701 [Exophiala sideris]KAK5068582.1 hypothetical protein LTR69_000702 [Exophiala sideris]KAK5186180.1 hypothetical protein LTR44_001235 [Eurotiomycetes sp. CCFEE 6388]